MIRRQRTDLPPDVYPHDPWALAEDAYSPRFLYLTETIFSLSNGYVGVRGTHEEGQPAHLHGTFVNGFHETWPIVHAEMAYGLATTGQTIVNVPDATMLRVSVDNEWFDLQSTRLLAYRRWLDFRTGVLERVVEWATSSGTRVTQWTRRLVSLTNPELMAFHLQVTVDRPATVNIESRMVNRQDAVQSDTVAENDPRRAQAFSHRVLEPRAATIGDLRLIQGWVTANSGMGLVAGFDHVPEGEHELTWEVERQADDFGITMTAEVTPDRPFGLTKLAVYRSCPSDPTPAERNAVESLLGEAVDRQFEGLCSTQRSALDGFWDLADIRADAGDEIQRAIRWTLFQLHQASALVEHGSIPAKGLTGQAYDGHYFWDTEIYVIPFLIYSAPEIAARILRFRHSMLPDARQRARELSHKGALFPWRTITGKEASAYFLAGTAQYHINADVVYALRKYIEVTGDDDLLWEFGVEIAVETARLWVDLGFFRGNRFHIHGVTGPDEYTALVDDNAYTNVMARMNLRFASEVVERMRAEQPDRWEDLRASLDLDDEEVITWRLAADSMYVPFDETLGITPQDDDFLAKERWDFDNTPPSKYPLLLHFHPLTIYRFQVLKQADVVLSDFLLGDEFSSALKRANYEYYDPLTTGDSSLSACVQSIIASEIGLEADAMRHFEHALFMDLGDLAGNTTDGIHMASAGGVWMALVYGFGGLRDHGGHIRLHPRLPAAWRRLAFRLRLRAGVLSVTVYTDRVDLDVSGDQVEVTVWNDRVVVSPGLRVSVARPVEVGQSAG